MCVKILEFLNNIFSKPFAFVKCFPSCLVNFVNTTHTDALGYNIVYIYTHVHIYFDVNGYTL